MEDLETTGKYLIKKPRPHVCFVPRTHTKGDLWQCDYCGKYYLAFDDPYGYPFREISKWRALRLIKKHGKS